ncbi:YbhN family protein [Brachybacterium sp. GCM10030252]|uniref:lysylphosphatidylglycerol synthase transmembrane domain-containing protein n=1 Tax=Brachybacterium sp. GCM10030252 TaxID=3273380 RepID=UPI003608005A
MITPGSTPRGEPSPGDPGDGAAPGRGRAGDPELTGDPETTGGPAAWLSGDLDLEHPPRLGGRRIAAALASLLLVLALLGWGLPLVTGAGWAQIGRRFAEMPIWSVPLMVVLGAVALALESATVRTAFRGSRYRDAVQGHAASQAVGMAVPGGSMIGTVLLGYLMRRSGLGMQAIITGVIAASLVDMALTSAGIPLLGLVAYALTPLVGPEAPDLPGGLWAALAAVAGGLVTLCLAALLMRRSVLASVVAQASQVLPVADPEAILRQRDALVALLRTRAAGLLGPTVLARAVQWLALLVAIRALGIEVPLLVTLAIFALGRVLALVPLTPGGTGIAETVGAAALVALGTAGDAAATAMLLLAVATFVVPCLAGGVAAAMAMTRAPARRR